MDRPTLDSLRARAILTTHHARDRHQFPMTYNVPDRNALKGARAIMADLVGLIDDLIAALAAAQTTTTSTPAAANAATSSG